MDKTEIRFTQITCAADGTLYGLDGAGRIWVEAYENLKIVWKLVGCKRHSEFIGK